MKERKVCRQCEGVLIPESYGAVTGFCCLPCEKKHAEIEDCHNNHYSEKIKSLQERLEKFEGRHPLNEQRGVE